MLSTGARNVPGRASVLLSATLVNTQQRGPKQVLICRFSSRQLGGLTRRRNLKGCLSAVITRNGGAIQKVQELEQVSVRWLFPADEDKRDAQTDQKNSGPASSRYSFAEKNLAPQGAGGIAQCSDWHDEAYVFQGQCTEQCKERDSHQ